MPTNIKKEKSSKKGSSPYPKKKTEHPEFRKGKSEYILCPACYSVYYNKAWHHALSGDKHFKETKEARFVICPADKMIKEKEYEGQIIMENVPAVIKYDLFHLVENMAARAFHDDPMDRVISIKEKNGRIEILTTENQLAQRIAMKIKESFKNKMGSGWQISHSHREDPLRIIWK